MKAWMKTLMWLILGGGVGFFAGMQVGQKQEQRRRMEIQAHDLKERQMDEEAREERANTAMDIYRAGVTDDVESIWEAPKQTAADEDDIPPIPTEEDVRIPEPMEIPVLHPTQLIPVIISEEEYNANKEGYDREKLVYYAGDDVLYNSATQSIIENPNDVLGIGTLMAGFGGDPRHPNDVIFVKNETFGTLFRVEKVDEAFCDAVDGTAPPEDDEPDDDDDFWNDV